MASRRTRPPYQPIWDGAIRWLRRQGVVRSGTFAVEVRGGWHGQVFEMRL